MHPRSFMDIRFLLASTLSVTENEKGERGRKEHRPDPWSQQTRNSSSSFKSFSSVRGEKCCNAPGKNKREVPHAVSPNPGCFEGANPSASSFHLFLPGAILNSVTSGSITQQCWENGLFQANSSQPAAHEREWANESLRLLSTTERTKPEENFVCHAVVINSKCKIFLLVRFRKYCWMYFKLCRVMTSKYQFHDWKILIFLNP